MIRPMMRMRMTTTKEMKKTRKKKKKRKTTIGHGGDEGDREMTERSRMIEDLEERGRESIYSGLAKDPST